VAEAAVVIQSITPTVIITESTVVTMVMATTTE